jgi:Rtf2 RING-finger
MVCNKKFTPDDIILINAVTKEDLKIADDRLEFQKSLALSKKQEKKRKKTLDDKDTGKEVVKKKKVVVATKVSENPGVNANMLMPDLSALKKLEPSKAVASLYTDKTKQSKSTWINQGNFNRYG